MSRKQTAHVFPKIPANRPAICRRVARLNGMESTRRCHKPEGRNPSAALTCSGERPPTAIHEPENPTGACSHEGVIRRRPAGILSIAPVALKAGPGESTGIPPFAPDRSSRKIGASLHPSAKTRVAGAPPSVAKDGAPRKDLRGTEKD